MEPQKEKEMNPIEQIRAEIARCKEWQPIATPSLDRIEALLNTLPQEKPSEDFEEHWREFEDWADSYNTTDYPTAYTRKDIARHFYKLGLKARKEDTK